MHKQSNLVHFMKGVSITAIVLFHLLLDYLDVPPLVATAAKFGGAGIHIFFLCSGFGLTVSQLNRPSGPLAFLKRRFGKIYLPYILVVAVSAIVPFLYSGPDKLTAFLSHALLFKMFVPAYIASFGAHFWFLSTLFQFYFAFPLLEKLRSRWSARQFLLLCCGISLGWMMLTACLGVNEERVWGNFFLQYLWEFGLGMCLGAKYQKTSQEPPLPRLLPTAAVTIAALGLYGFLAMQGGAASAFNDVFGAIAFGGVCLLLYRLTFLRPVMLGINKFSYELYLVHVLVLSTCEYLLSPVLPTVLWCALGLGLSIPIAWLYHRLWAGRK